METKERDKTKRAGFRLRGALMSPPPPPLLLLHIQRKDSRPAPTRTSRPWDSYIRSTSSSSKTGGVAALLKVPLLQNKPEEDILLKSPVSYADREGGEQEEEDQRQEQEMERHAAEVKEEEVESNYEGPIFEEPKAHHYVDGEGMDHYTDNEFDEEYYSADDDEY